MDLLAPGHGGLPAVVGHQVGGDDLQAGVVGGATAHCRAQVGLAGRRAHRGSHLAPAAQQRGDELRPHVARSAGDQNNAHWFTSMFMSMR
jgi:hypothetical protein